MELTEAYGKNQKLNQSLQSITKNKLSRMTTELGEKEQKIKVFKKNLDDKDHIWRTFESILITFHQQYDGESKKTEHKKYTKKKAIIFLTFFSLKKQNKNIGNNFRGKKEKNPL